jgi:hypothetical protein
MSVPVQLAFPCGIAGGLANGLGSVQRHLLAIAPVEVAQ